MKKNKTLIINCFPNFDDIPGIAGAIIFLILLVLLVWMICVRATRPKKPEKVRNLNLVKFFCNDTVFVKQSECTNP